MIRRLSFIVCLSCVDEEYVNCRCLIVRVGKYRVLKRKRGERCMVGLYTCMTMYEDVWADEDEKKNQQLDGPTWQRL